MCKLQQIFTCLFLWFFYNVPLHAETHKVILMIDTSNSVFGFHKRNIVHVVEAVRRQFPLTNYQAISWNSFVSTDYFWKPHTQSLSEVVYFYEGGSTNLGFATSWVLEQSHKRADPCVRIIAVVHGKPSDASSYQKALQQITMYDYLRVLVIIDSEVALESPLQWYSQNSGYAQPHTRAMLFTPESLLQSVQEATVHYCRGIS